MRAFLHPEQLKDESRKQRFIQEAKSASSLNHPNIITIHEIDHADGADFMVMEFVAGKTLQQLIPNGGMPVPDVLKNRHCELAIRAGERTIWNVRPCRSQGV